MQNKQVTASIWGAGGIAETHAQTLKKIGIKVEAVYDIKKENAERVAALCDATIATSDENEFLSIEVDVVHLCTPANLHYEQMNKLIKLNKNIFCEKPLTLNSEEAIKLKNKVKDKKIITGVGFNVRFHESIQKIKKTIEDETFGPIRLVHGNYLQEFNALPAPLDWRYNPKTAGKMRAVSEIGSHWIDLITYLTSSKIVEVSATFSKFSPQRKIKNSIMYPLKEDGEIIDIDSEDAAILTFKFDNGFIGSCVLSESSPGRINQLNFEITGENKNVWWNSEDTNKYHVGVKNEGVSTIVNPFTGGFPDTHLGMFTEFYKDISKGYTEKNCLYPTIEDGAYNVLITEAIYKSANEDSRWIKL